MCTTYLHTSEWSADRREERSHIVDEQLGLLERREVTAAWHVGPVRDVVPRLAPVPRCTQCLLRESGDAGGQFDAASGEQFAAAETLPVHPRRGGRRPGDPVQHHVVE